MKRGTDHTWCLVKYTGNIAIYARCSCGYEYCCSRNKSPADFEQEIKVVYRYCPMCGARKKWISKEIIRKEIWE